MSITIVRPNEDIHLTRDDINLIFRALEAGDSAEVTEADRERAREALPNPDVDFFEDLAQSSAAWRVFDETIERNGRDPQVMRDAAYTFIAKELRSTKEVYASLR